jgi:hypothetical protein
MLFEKDLRRTSSMYEFKPLYQDGVKIGWIKVWVHPDYPSHLTFKVEALEKASARLNMEVKVCKE